MSFTGFLKGNTTATLKLGPFLDSTDGNTAETALTLSQADIRLSKNGGDFAQKNEATSATHDELGYYDTPINATDTNTYGRLRVAVHESGALAVVQDYLVLPEVVYDSFFPSAAGAPLPLWGVIDWGTAQASAAGTLVHRSGLNLANDIPNGSIDYVYGGTGAGQLRVMHDFVNTTDTASISPDWITTPSTDSTYVTFGAPPAPTNVAALPKVDVEALAGDEQSLTDLKHFADTGYNPATSKIAGVVLADTVTTLTGHTPQTGDAYALIGATGSGLTSLASQASVDVIDDLIDTEIAIVDAIVDTLVAGVITGAAATGTLSTTQATTNLTGYADNQLIGRVIIWLTGACEGEASDITDYANTGGLITFTALTTAPGNGDTFKIV